MTPADQAIQQRQEAIEFIFERAPQILREKLAQNLKPSIRLNIDWQSQSPLPIGASKFGGVPDVPEGFEWPLWNETPLGFLAQFNLEEIAPFDTQHLLPQSGLLSFFISFDEEKEVWGDASQREGWRVFWLENWGLQPSEFMPGGQTVLPVLPVQPSVSWTLPFVTDTPIADFFDEDSPFFNEEANEEYLPFYSDFDDKFSSLHKIGGWPNTLQEPMEPQCRLQFETYQKKQDYWDEGGAGEWRFLFQFDSNAYIEQDWLYVGVFYFWVRPIDLENGDFSSTWLIQQIS